ncbi:hypothetical protein H1C71_033668 [Ictidomys tridecemlineatus]|nr:hypothetical protein H1C71_033668 [Ictidomys tridecemlineatus]
MKKVSFLVVLPPLPIVRFLRCSLNLQRSEGLSMPFQGRSHWAHRIGSGPRGLRMHSLPPAELGSLTFWLLLTFGTRDWGRKAPPPTGLLPQTPEPHTPGEPWHAPLEEVNPEDEAGGTWEKMNEGIEWRTSRKFNRFGLQGALTWTVRDRDPILIPGSL